MYTYLIGWSKHDRWYYGVRVANVVEAKQDLWSMYYTSSLAVTWMTTLMGPPDVVEIRRQFRTATEARSWESRVLRRLRANHSERWLNGKSNQMLREEKSKRQPIRKPLPMTMPIRVAAKAERDWNNMLATFERDRTQEVNRKQHEAKRQERLSHGSNTAKRQKYLEEKAAWEAYKTRLKESRKSREIIQPETLTLDDIV